MNREDRRRALSAGIILPGREKKYGCRVCADRGEETYFDDMGDYQRHVVACANEHGNELREKHDMSDLEGIRTPFDPEFFKWGRTTEVGKRWWNRVREGRPGPVRKAGSVKHGDES